MLILTRKVGEKIIVNDDVVVTLLEIHGDQAKIGVDAPRNVKVYRQEIFNSIQEENRRAAGSVMQLPLIDIPDRPAR
ncbi:MAG: carbon storage regulator CsrA [Spirochaetes bacterium]|nr:carbon storage regulator CsrA [Spirochaetota bacterium]